MGFNLFAYCNNNPVNRADPTGHAFMFLTAAIGAVVGAVVGGVIAAAKGKSVVKGALIGAAVGGLVGLGAGAAAGVLLAGSATASTAAVMTGASTLAATVSAGGLGAGVTYVTNNISQAVSNAAPTVQAAASKVSNAAPKATKVVAEIKNNILGLERVGSALKTDMYHAFPNIVDNYAGYATQTSLGNATLYQLQGALNGVAGRFEWIVQAGQVTHRMFVEGGGINGIPIMP
jgi:hypothetical protein